MFAVLVRPFETRERVVVNFRLFGPSSCISFQKFPLQLSVFLHCSSGLISAALVLSTKDLFMKVSVSHDITLCG